MQKIFLLLFAAVLGANALQAQTTFELIPTGGYTFADQVNFYNGYGRIEGAPHWGGSMQFNVSRNFGVELQYTRIDAQAGSYAGGYPPQQISTQPVGINYAMAGPVWSAGFPESPVRFFFGGLVGAAIFSPNPTDYASNTRFAWGMETGTNIYVSPHIGLRLKAELLSPVQGVGGGFYFGNWGGGASVTTYSTIYQFGFSAGLILGLGRPFAKPRPRTVIYQQAPPVKRYYVYPQTPRYYYY